MGRTGRVRLSAAGRAEAGRGPRPGLWERGETGRGARPALNPRPGPPRPGGESWEPAGGGGGRAPLATRPWTTATSTPRPGWDGAGGAGLGRRGRGRAGPGIRNVLPKARSARGGRPGAEPFEEVKAGGLRWELQVKEPAGAGTEGQAQHGDKKPLPRAQAAPALGADGEAEREAPRRCAPVHTGCAGVTPPRQTPSTSPTHNPGCGWTLHPQEGHHPPREEHEASRAAAGNRTRKAGLGGGRGLNYHLLGPDAGPAHGGPTALRATSGPQVPSAGRGQGVRPGHSRGRQGWTNPSSQPHGVACGQSPCLTSCPPAHRPPGGAPPAPDASLLPGDGLEGPAGMSSCCFAHSPTPDGLPRQGAKTAPQGTPMGSVGPLH